MVKILPRDPAEVRLEAMIKRMEQQVGAALKNYGLELRSDPHGSYTVGFSGERTIKVEFTSAPVSRRVADDGIALTSIAHPPGLIEKLGQEIAHGKLGQGIYGQNDYPKTRPPTTLKGDAKDLAESLTIDTWAALLVERRSEWLGNPAIITIDLAELQKALNVAAKKMLERQ